MSRTRGIWATWLMLAALIWSALILVAAFTAAAYQGESRSSNGQSLGTSATLAEVNGSSIAWLLAIPLLLTLAAAAGLWLRRSRGSATGTRLAWGAVACLTTLALLGIASIGVLILPAALLVAVAAALTSAGPPRSAHSAVRRS